MSLTFDQLRETNTRRCEAVFHPINDWSPADWGNAMAGEAGETCNAVKKLRRWEDNTLGYPTIYEELIAKVADELADTITYADHLAARLGIDLGEAVREKFNRVSERHGSDIKLPPPEPKTQLPHDPKQCPVCKRICDCQ